MVIVYVRQETMDQTVARRHAGLGKQVFDGPTQCIAMTGAIFFKYLSKDGDENYPGTVELRVWYTARKEGAPSQMQRPPGKLNTKSNSLG